MVPAALPIPRSLHVATLLLEGDGLTILASSEATAVRCPVCGEPANRVHRRYARTLADLPWARLAVRLRVQVRTFLCDNPSCPRTVFAERLDGVAAAWVRRTERQREALTAIAFALGGEAGARQGVSGFSLSGSVGNLSATGRGRLHDPAPVRLGGGRPGRADAELAADVGEVGCDGLLGDEPRRGDGVVGGAVGQQAQDLQLARRQARPSRR